MGGLTRAHALLQVPFSAALLCGHGRDRGRISDCSRISGQCFLAQAVVVAHRHRSPAPAICQGHLATGTCLCTQGGLGFCACIAITRHIQVPTGQWAVCEFGMNVLVCVCGLLLLRFMVIMIGICI